MITVFFNLLKGLNPQDLLDTSQILNYTCTCWNYKKQYLHSHIVGPVCFHCQPLLIFYIKFDCDSRGGIYVSFWTPLILQGMRTA